MLCTSHAWILPSALLASTQSDQVMLLLQGAAALSSGAQHPPPHPSNAEVAQLLQQEYQRRECLMVPQLPLRT